MSLTLQTNFTPAPNSAKISQLPELTNLTGEELILVALDGANYTVPKKLLSSVNGGATLFGPTNLYVTQTYTFVITNFDMSLDYNISVDVGTVSSINASNGSFSYTAPEVAGPAVLTLNGNSYNLTINPAITIAPTIIVPANNSTVSCNTVLVSASAFSNLGPADTQLAANWQLATDPAFTNVVQQSLNDSVNLNSYLFENLSLSTTYYVRVSYVGHISPVSQYSTPISFTTSSVCYPSEEIYECVSPNIQSYGKYGQALATTLDGTILAVCAPSETVVGSATNVGNVYIYSTTTFPYVLLQTIPSPSSSGSFGDTIELSSNGDFLFIGDPLSNSLINPTLSNAGVVYVYKKVNNAFSLLGTIEPSVPNAFFYFGQYVKMSQDMSTLVVSSYSNYSSTPAPSIFVYTFNSTLGSWTLSTSFTNTLISTTTLDTNYGSVVDINSTGTIVVTSSSTNNGGYGVVFVYTNNNGVWTTTQILPDTSNVLINSGFGNTLTLSPDGTKLFVGASSNDAIINGTTYTGQGQVFYYQLTSGSWVLEQTINAPTNLAFSDFGYSVKVSPDGNMLVIVGREIYVYSINSSGQYTYTATLESVISNLGNWAVYSNYGLDSGIPNQIIAINNSNNRLFIGNQTINSEIYSYNGVVYTFSCFQNPTFQPIAANTNATSGGSY